MKVDVLIAWIVVFVCVLLKTDLATAVGAVAVLYSLDSNNNQYKVAVYHQNNPNPNTKI